MMSLLIYTWVIKQIDNKTVITTNVGKSGNILVFGVFPFKLSTLTSFLQTIFVTLFTVFDLSNPGGKLLLFVTVSVVVVVIVLELLKILIQHMNNKTKKTMSLIFE